MSPFILILIAFAAGGLLGFAVGMKLARPASAGKPSGSMVPGFSRTQMSFTGMIDAKMHDRFAALQEAAAEKAASQYFPVAPPPPAAPKPAAVAPAAAAA